MYIASQPCHSKLKYCNCQTPRQLANPTQLYLVGEGVDFVFPRKKKKNKKEGTTHI